MRQWSKRRAKGSRLALVTSAFELAGPADNSGYARKQRCCNEQVHSREGCGSSCGSGMKRRAEPAPRKGALRRAAVQQQHGLRGQRGRTAWVTL